MKVPPSRFLMPIAFSALLGGMLTLVGTSINLFVAGAAAAINCLVEQKIDAILRTRQAAYVRS